MAEMVSGEFVETEFASRYQRNNKKNSLKNLRCFPSCGFRHKERGFCGRSVLFKTSLNSSAASNYKLYCFAEFMSCGKNGELTSLDYEKDNLQVQVGSIISLSQAQDRCRDKSNPTKPWLLGEELMEKSSSQSTVFEFNKQRRGWHYGWQSNKHTCDTLHCFRVYIFASSSSSNSGEFTSEVIPDKKLICRFILDSGKFMLFCRRRRRFYMSPSAPNSQPLKKLKSEFFTPTGSLIKMDRLLKDLVLAMRALKMNQMPSVALNERELMVDDLSRYLLHDQDFKSAMEKLKSSTSTSSMATAVGDLGFDLTDQKYLQFLAHMERHLEAYRRTRNISISEFEIVFKQPTVKVEDLSFDNIAEQVSNNLTYGNNFSRVSSESDLFDAEMDKLLLETNFDLTAATASIEDDQLVFSNLNKIDQFLDSNFESLN